MDGQLSFEFEQRKPIKGYPELHWTGKRPYTSTQYYPAQLKESFGEPKDGWMNKIFWGDNLQVMSHMLKDYRGKIDLIYIDPPFDSRVEYKKKITVKKKTIQNDTSTFEEKQYGDIWTNDEYLQFMYERLILMKELLSETGSIYVHCDWHKGHYLKILMDELFGADNFINEITWHYYNKMAPKSACFPRTTDKILVYAKGPNYKFNTQYEKREEPVKQLVRKFVDGKAINARDENGNVMYKMSYEKRIDDVWRLPMLQPADQVEPVGYPTQKPEKMLERIIRASSDVGDIVFDCFMGSGTTQAVAMKCGRRFIGADINLGSVQITSGRLLKAGKILDESVMELTLDIDEELESAKETRQIQESVKYTGFEVYYVNNYDFFRNPVEAKELIIDALGIQKYDSSSVYDGELDGWMVKIMPTNRIATKADLEELKANLPYRTFEKRKEENPNGVVEKIRIICMGHEADLKASLEQELSAYKLEIEILDILRDKTDLQFKREADANVIKEVGNVVIKEFYPMNLLQKLSMQKESVEDWRQLVESIYIDWNYDGETMRPTVCDIPGKDEFVSGVYEIPASATRIKVKITDLLSESLELEV